ncbi:MAG: hypothetical protein PHG06_20480 [Parabacteroides sp.]|nr:hypothetical protein [Parabacteroides sp.]
MIRKTLALVLLLSFVGCGWKTTCTKTRSYELGEVRMATVGSNLVQSGCFASRYDPLGLNLVLWNRSSQNDNDFLPVIDKELIYSGREGNVLHISYREFYITYNGPYMGSYARTPFFQQVYYDLNKSNLIIFKDWVIHVLEADNAKIRFKVLNEPPRPLIPPPN